ncbi:MAG: sulfotransferase [Chromatiales bacterium]|nr:sulfotransferase [Chromatiales bacterium]
MTGSKQGLSRTRVSLSCIKYADHQIQNIHKKVIDKLHSLINHMYNPKECPVKDVRTKDVRTMVFSIGFYSGGSSIIGHLLTAHPNIVMADEARLNSFVDINNRYDELFNYLLQIDSSRYQDWKLAFDTNKIKHDARSPSRIKRYMHVPNQYQGHFHKLQVIGNKNRRKDVSILANTDLLKDLRSQLEDNKISLKFIFAVRNLYDTIATIYIKYRVKEKREHRAKLSSINDIIEAMEIVCSDNQKILKQIDSNDVLICKNEDLIANPKLQITRLCDFLKVSASADYINACASCVFNKPTNERLELDWSGEHKQKINSLIKKYDFLYGYDYS